MPPEPVWMVRRVRKQDDGCWLWTVGLGTGGYARFRRQAAHRLVYEALVGPIPEGLELDHLCRVRNCVNPQHLEPVTRAENVRRQGAAMTHCKHGHEYTPDNTYIRPNTGNRDCRACRAERDRKSVAKRRLRDAA